MQKASRTENDAAMGPDEHSPVAELGLHSDHLAEFVPDDGSDSVLEQHRDVSLACGNFHPLD